MNFDQIRYVYFLGIGGIGMSALARYFLHVGKSVSGYDKTSTALTDALSNEGMQIHFEEDLSYVQKLENHKSETLVVFTPAIPSNHLELKYLESNSFTIKKRAEVLGIIANHGKCIGIAGTHGKTTTTTMTAHILKQSSLDCSAFLGGISKNYGSNLLLSDKGNNIVVEADEFDRSFLHLKPFCAVITSVDPDHLDIYTDKSHFQDAFTKFTSNISNKGFLVVKYGLEFPISYSGTIYSYGIDKGDFHAENLKLQDGLYVFDVVTPDSIIESVKLGLAGTINVENALAAIALAYNLGVTKEEIKGSLSNFKGAKRRLDFQVGNSSSSHSVYIDDYAHHPEEIKACLTSVKNIFPKRKLTGVFQPHLYTRTRDFYTEFAKSLSLLDEVILLDIYPAREEPIEGITSKVILDLITSKQKILLTKSELINYLEINKSDVLLTMGAGDIDKFVAPIKLLIESRL